MTTKRSVYDFYIRLKYGLKLNKPLFLMRLAKTFFQVKVLGKVPLKYIDFAFDYRCNLRCKHCFAKAFTTENKTKMTVKDYEKVAQEAMKLGVVDFDFQGGEPFLPALFPFLEKLIKAVKPSQNLVSVTTNGTFVDAKKIRRLKELGVDNLIFSLDSGLAAEHDGFRGVNGVFEKALKNIDMVLDNGLTVAINTTITHQSLYSEGFKKLIDLAERRKIFVNTILPVPVGNWKGNSQMILTKDDMRYLNKLRSEHMFLRRDVDSNFVRWGCPAVKEAMYITPYGDVLACPFIHISLGNALKEPLKEIRERGLKVKFFDHYHQKCLAGEDYDFMKKYSQCTRNRKGLPIDSSEVKNWWTQK